MLVAVVSFGSTVCPQKKNKANYFLALCHQTTMRPSHLWHSDLTDNCKSAYDYVFHLTSPA